MTRQDDLQQHLAWAYLLVDACDKTDVTKAALIANAQGISNILNTLSGSPQPVIQTNNENVSVSSDMYVINTNTDPTKPSTIYPAA